MNTITKYRLAKYATGGTNWKSPSSLSAMGSAASMAGNLIDQTTPDTDKTATIGGSMLSMGGQGAAMGAFAGPIGAAIGGGVGLIGGAITGNMKANEAQKAQRAANLNAAQSVEQQSVGAYSSLPNNSLQNNELKDKPQLNFRKGGRINKYPAGGRVNEKAFDQWFKYNTPEGKQGWKSDDPRLDYDYKSYYSDAVTGKNPMQQDEQTMHFPDTYKYPNHPTFSVESKYYKGEKLTPALSWTGSGFKKEHGGYGNYNSELEKGEPFRTPDGKIHKVSDNAPTHAQGGVKLDLPQGTEILGNNMLQDKQFKQLGSKLKRTQDVADKSLEGKATSLARMTAIRNLNNVQTKWDNLMTMQESQKDTSDYRLYPKGGKVLVDTTDNINSYFREDDKFDEGYSSYMNPKDSTLRSKYFYASPDSSVEYETGPEGYVMNIYKGDNMPTVYDKNNPVPKDTYDRLTKSIDNLKAGNKEYVPSETKPKFANGGMYDPNEVYPEYKEGGIHIKKENVGKFTAYKKRTGKTTEEALHSKDPHVRQMANFARNAKKWHHEDGGTVQYAGGGNVGLDWMKNTPADQNLINEYVKSNPTSFGHDVSTDANAIGNYWKDIQSGKNNYFGENEYATGPSLYRFATNRSNSALKSVQSKLPNSVSSPNININYKQLDQTNPLSQDMVTQNAKQWQASSEGQAYFDKRAYGDSLEGVSGNSYENAGLLAATMAPTAYNIGRGLFGKVDQLNASNYNNPYEGEALSALKNRKFDIDPQLYEARAARGAMDYNAKNYARSQSEMLNRQQGNVQGFNKQVADLYAQKHNIENQYTGEYANALGQYGSQRAQSRLGIDMWNKQAQATKDNLLSTGISQGAQSVADYLKYRNQMRNENVRTNILKQYPQYYNYNLSGMIENKK